MVLGPVSTMTGLHICTFEVLCIPVAPTFLIHGLWPLRVDAHFLSPCRLP